MISGSSIAAGLKRASAGICFDVVHIAWRRSGECMKSMNSAAVAGSFALDGMPKPCVSVIGIGAIAPVPNVGIIMKPTFSPSFFCESGSAGVVLSVIDALPVLKSWMPW